MYPKLSDDLSYSDYINQCKNIIEQSRRDIHHKGADAERIINANAPFELKPETKTKKGALLIHGLFDCPFTMRDIADRLVKENIHCRGLLLPGHGTKPEDLLDIKYEQWIQAVQYGVQSLAKEVDDITLIGFSTGAALSINHAIKDKRIKRVILLAPAIRINETLDTFIGWNKFAKTLKERKKWLLRGDETNYTKYSSVTFNSVHQVSQLTKLVAKETKKTPVDCPILMIASREDETISSHMAVDFFMSQHHPNSELLLYSAHPKKTNPDKRINRRLSKIPELRIKHFSHPCIMFKPDNFHNGQYGDNPTASHKDNKNVIYGAYNTLESNFFDLLYNLGLAKNRRKPLSYNPDFEFMVEKICCFIS